MLVPLAILLLVLSWSTPHWIVLAIVIGWGLIRLGLGVLRTEDSDSGITVGLFMTGLGIAGLAALSWMLLTGYSVEDGVQVPQLSDMTSAFIAIFGLAAAVVLFMAWMLAKASHFDNIDQQQYVADWWLSFHIAAYVFSTMQFGLTSFWFFLAYLALGSIIGHREAKRIQKNA